MRECDMSGCIGNQQGCTYAVVGFGNCKKDGSRVGSIEQMVHDGDTIKTRAFGNFNIRFLGIDTPEVSFQVKKSVKDVIYDKNRKADASLSQINQYVWSEYLADPFAGNLPPFGEPDKMKGKELKYYHELVDYLKEKAGPGTAENHYEMAMGARDALIEEINKDINQLKVCIDGLCTDNFAIQVGFSWEVMDRYGRMLGYINRYQHETKKNPMPPLPGFYNERLLQRGVACIYTIWPNLDPYDRSRNILQLLNPFKAKKGSEVADKIRALKKSREWVRNARESSTGIFDKNKPLRLEPFELRYLGRRSPPDRWVIDLSSDEKIIRHPFNYHKIANMEDRLFINAEYLPLFTDPKVGWKKETR